MKKWLCATLALVMLVTMMSVMPMTTLAACKGDFNNDGRIDTLDVRLLLRAAIGNITPTQKQLWWGDYNIDNTLSTIDARELLIEVITSETSEAPSYAQPVATDWWGEKSVALLGDSISFGAGAADPLPEYSYVSHVKKAVKAANSGNMNYGFASAYPTAWGNYEATEIHDWPERSTKSDGTTAWICDNNNDGNRLFWIAMTSTTAWSTITYTLRKGTDYAGTTYDYTDDFNYFCVYYQVVSDGGMFCIADGNGGEVANIHGSKLYVNTATGDNNVTYRTAFYPLADCPTNSDGQPQITICHDGTSNPVSITGIGYYKNIDADTTTFNAYVRGGASLTATSDHVLTQAATAQTLIFALGYNDAYWHYDNVNSGMFTQKIDHLIDVCNSNNTRVIISDHVWDNTTVVERDTAQETAYQTVKAELKRFAKETNGIYIDQQSLNNSGILNALNTTYEHNGKACDGVHPNSAGHKLIAQNIVSAMDLRWASSWV